MSDDEVTRVTPWARALALLRGVSAPPDSAPRPDELTGWRCLEVDGEPEAYEHRTGGRVWLDRGVLSYSAWLWQAVRGSDGARYTFVGTDAGRLCAMAYVVGLVLVDAEAGGYRWQCPPSQDLSKPFPTAAECALDALRWYG